MSRPKAALIELYNSHDELLYSQALFLKNGGYDATLIVSESHRSTVQSFGLDQETVFSDASGKKGIALWKELRRIRSLILQRGIETVIFNTAHSNIIRNFCLLSFPANTKFFGTLHGVNKLRGSLTQRIISMKVKHYFLLNDYMLDKAKKVPHKGLKFAVYYPIFHPEFTAPAVVRNTPGDIWVCIPGHVEFKRRDYLSLVEAFAKISDKPSVRFIILGNGTHAHGNGPELKAFVEENHLQEYFRFFDGFVSNEIFHSFMKASDAVLPLTHPINAELQKYAEDQISGSFNLAFAYHKPLLMHKYYRRYPDFEENGLFYELEHFEDFLLALPKMLSESHSFYCSAKWGLEAQTEAYLRFLRS